MTTLRDETRLVKAARPIAVHTPHTLPFGPTDTSAGPRHALVMWYKAVEKHDHRTAIRLARELRRRWRISICLAPEMRGVRSS